ncbi:MAG: diguanylate cyclase [Betaproteobacteria bacterium]
MRSAKVVSANQKQLMVGVRNLLEAIVRLPVIRAATPESCEAFLTGLIRGFPGYRNIGVVNADGELICSALPLKSAVNFADMNFFQRVIKTRAFAVGDNFSGIGSDAPSINFGVPFQDGRGNVRGVVFVSVDPVYANKPLVEAFPYEGAGMAFLNDRGRILARYPDPAGLTGKSLPDSMLLRTILSKGGEGVARVAGLDGVPSLVAFVTVSSSPERIIYLAVSVPESAAFLAARPFLYRQAAILLGAILLVAVIIWLGNDRLILRRVSLLGKAAEQMRAGNLGARSGIAHSRDELGQLAEAFDGMCKALDHRELERTHALKEVRRLNEQLEQRVTERTTQLETTKKRLEGSFMVLHRQSMQMNKLSEMSNLLQSCLTVEEANTVVSRFVGDLFSVSAGGLFMTSPARDAVEASIVWGEIPSGEKFFAPEDCWALRGGRPYVVGHAHPGPYCRHVGEEAQHDYICVPLTAHAETMGILHLRGFETLPGQDREMRERERVNRLQLAENLAERTALAIANIRLHETLLALSVHDPLTGLYNRRHMEEMIAREELQAQRNRSSFGIIMIDVDHFKNFNDTYGHPAGDAVLREVGRFLQGRTRSVDIACRYGGEEFVVILPGASTEMTLQRAEEWRSAFTEINLEYRGKPLPRVTLSLGVATFPKHGASWLSALRTADEALYAAKQQGRNRVAVAPEPEPAKPAPGV